LYFVRYRDKRVDFDKYIAFFRAPLQQLLTGSSTIFIKLATKLNRYRYMSLLFYTFIWALMFFYLKSLTFKDR
jgi:hypothetical protein